MEGTTGMHLMAGNLRILGGSLLGQDFDLSGCKMTGMFLGMVLLWA